MMFVSFALAILTSGEDWPQYHGPRTDRHSDEAIGLRSWGLNGPPQVWRADTPGGFSSMTIAAGKAFTLVLRERDGDEREVCVALDLESGEELWAAELRKAEYDGGGGAGTSDNSGGDGPRSTPSYADGRVHILDSRLVLRCLDAETGEKLWQTNLEKNHAGRNIRWQNAASPLVAGGRVFVAGGGPGQSLLAFDAETGDVLWQTGDEWMTHATPIVATLHDVEQVIFFVRSGLVSVAPEDGEELWRVEYPYRTSTAASPVVHGDVVYCSAGYGVGAGAFRINKNGDRFESELLWRKRNDLMNHWSTPVAVDGHLYGMFSFKEYGDGPLQCVELSTGEVKWSVDGFGPGNCILVGSDLVALSDAGEVVLVDPDPSEYRELARADVLEGKCWSMPTFSDGQLYVRSTREGARLDLSGDLMEKEGR